MVNTVKRFSKQRFTVLNELSKLDTHPTADEIYEIVKKIIPSISLGTVYRNLNNLCEEGSVVKFSSEGKEHFDAITKPHIHLCCEKCGKISDVYSDFSVFNDEFLNNENFRINNIIISGICRNCC